MRSLLASIAVAFVVLHASLARALSQPNGTTVPSPDLYCNSGQPGGLLAIFACQCTQSGVCNIGASCPGGSTQCDLGQNGTCESTIWHSPNDNTCIPSNHSGLDPVAEAAVKPETFHPTCALTFKLLSRGTAIFQDIFGWYNVTGSAPALSDLHPMLNCGDTIGKSVVLNLQNEPAYTGGDIGFFLATPESHTAKGTCDGGNCCASIARLQSGVGYVYYSQREYNPDAAGANSYIHLLTYKSHIAAHRFYFAWEDIFGGSNDDFTDLVTSVDGVECSGAGQPCKTGQPGACSEGITACSGGTVTCEPAVKPQPERCNGVDDDCNGKVDDGATCPNPGQVCYQGQCVNNCSGVEFPCAAGLSCDHTSGLCVKPSCVGVTCAGGKVCRAGQCVAPCQGVVCPHGQTCVGDACVNLCAGVKCASGQVCRDGVCLPGCGACSGVVCAPPLTCDATSHDCIDPSCPGGCAAGTYCKSGSCVSDCSGAICPSGQTCQNGQCVANGAGGGGGVFFDAGVAGSSGQGASAGSGGTSSSAPLPYSNSGCGCAVPGRTGDADWPNGALGLLALAGVFAANEVRRRRRRERAS